MKHRRILHPSERATGWDAFTWARCTCDNGWSDLIARCPHHSPRNYARCWALHRTPRFEVVR